ncbi:MAG: hypothetical protein JNM18_07475 [Planctomycetaceae bacterium]|nr:hypothetical protein [Planctomycetaceae bacterium]
MRAMYGSALAVLLAAWVVWSVSPLRVVEAVPAASAPSSELITMLSPLGDVHQQLVVIDPRVRTLSVYHIQTATGEVALKSVRNIHWDLQLSHFNNTGLTPPEIRTLLDQTTSAGR